MGSECRICLKKKRQVSSLFDEDNDRRKYAEKITEIASIKISENDGLSDVICFVCVKSLHTVFEFKQLCQDSDVKLRKKHGLRVEYLEVDRDDFNIFLSSSVSAPDDIAIKNEQLEFEDTDNHFDTSPVQYNLDEVLEMPETDPMALALKRINPDITIVKIEGTTVKKPVQRRKKNVSEDTVTKRVRRKKSDSEDPAPKRRYRRRRRSDSEDSEPTLKVKHETDLLEKETQLAKTVLPRVPKPKAEKRQYFCEICGKCFDSRTILQSHLLRHQGIKPNICGDCGKAFVLKSELRRHTFIHTGVRPYPCRFCGRPFSDYSSKIKHERCHMNERMYKCDVCGNGFNYSYALKKHMLVHSGAKNFFCTLCKQDFRTKCNLNNHIRRRHKDLDHVQKERLLATGDLLAALAKNTTETNQIDNVNIDIVNVDTITPQPYVRMCD